MVSTKKYGILLALVLGLAGFANAMDGEPATVETVTQSLTGLQTKIGEHLLEMGQLKAKLKEMNKLVQGFSTGNAQSKQVKWNLRQGLVAAGLAGAAYLARDAYLGNGQQSGSLVSSSDYSHKNIINFKESTGTNSSPNRMPQCIIGNQQECNNLVEPLFSGPMTRGELARALQYAEACGEPGMKKEINRRISALDKEQGELNNGLNKINFFTNSTTDVLQKAQSACKDLQLAAQKSNLAVDTAELKTKIELIERVLELQGVLKRDFDAIVGLNSGNATRATPVGDLRAVVEKLKELVADGEANDLDTNYIKEKIKKIEKWIKATEGKQQAVDNGLAGIVVSVNSAKAELEAALVTCNALKADAENSEEEEDTTALEAKIANIKELLEALKPEQDKFDSGLAKLQKVSAKSSSSQLTKAKKTCEDLLNAAKKTQLPLDTSVLQAKIAEIERLLADKESLSERQIAAMYPGYTIKPGSMVTTITAPNGKDVLTLSGHGPSFFSIMPTKKAMDEFVAKVKADAESSQTDDASGANAAMTQQEFDDKVAAITVSSTATSDDFEGIKNYLEELKKIYLSGAYDKTKLNAKIKEVNRALSRKRFGISIQDVQ